LALFFAVLECPISSLQIETSRLYKTHEVVMKTTAALKTQTTLHNHETHLGNRLFLLHIYLKKFSELGNNCGQTSYNKEDD
jgi:hypothetical protein